MIRWAAIAVALLVAACDDPAPAEPPPAAPAIEGPASRPQEAAIPPLAAVGPLPEVKPTLPSPRPAAARPGNRFAACDRYDEDVEAAVAKWWIGGPDWLWWRAQLFQESRCNTAARSPVGAEGVAQFMPATWADILRRMGEDPKAVPRTHARAAIRAGAFYMRVLKDQWAGWSGSPDVLQTHFHAAAGYNAGSGNVVKAWRACGRPAAWDETAACLAQVTGRHASETIGYLESIRRFRADMQ